MSTRANTHPVNVSHLVVGLVFLGIAGSWALRTSGIVDTADYSWLVPAVLVVSGVVGLMAFAGRGLRRQGDQEPAGEESEVDIATLEAAAFAPYPRDVERTRLLASQPAPDHDTHRHTNSHEHNDTDSKENDR